MIKQTHKEITKTFTFDAGHRLSNYEGKCRRLHGHTYLLEVTITGELDEIGFILDFGTLKDIVKEEVDAKFDHKMLLKEGDPFNEKIRSILPETDDQICWVSYNPTAENIATDVFASVAKRLPDGIVLTKIRLFETPTSYAEIIAEK